MRNVKVEIFIEFLQLLSAVSVLSQVSGRECEPRGECLENGCEFMNKYVLSHCSCIKGFGITVNNTCAPTDPTWRLMYTSMDHMSLYSMHGKFLRNMKTDTDGFPTDVTGDVGNEVIYWTDNENRDDVGVVYKTSSLIPYQPGIQGKRQVVVDVGIRKPAGIAFDWLTGNLYFVDSELSFLAVCVQNTSTTTCAVLLHATDLNSIALDPNDGIMFWTTTSGAGQMGRVMRARMDGSLAKTIVSTSTNFQPYYITVDKWDSRIYWVELYDGTIQSSRYDGTDRKVITKTPKSPFALDVFEQLVFWTDTDHAGIMSANKFTGENETRVIADSSNVFGGLYVMHSSKQRKLRVNQCDQLRCSHICVLSGPTAAKCICPAGTLLNGNTCEEDFKGAKLLVAQQETLYFMRLNDIGANVFQQIALPSEIKAISALVYSPIRKSLIISDAESRTISEFNLLTKDYRILVENDIINVTSLTIDFINENIIWLDAGKQTVEVLSLATLAKSVVRANIENATDILFVPDQSVLYISQRGKVEIGEEINKIYLGRELEQSVDYCYSGIGEHFYLTYDEETGKAIAASGNTSMLRTTGHYEIESLRLPSEWIVDVKKIRNQIFWVDQKNELKVGVLNDDAEMIWDKMKTNFKPTTTTIPSRLVLASIDDTILSHFEILWIGHDCSPGNPSKLMCSHICLPLGIGLMGQCSCPHGFHLRRNGLTCIRHQKGSRVKAKHKKTS